jgi:predicted ATPase
MITRIAINNFKAFREAEINLNYLNLFTGLNGMGKSTFIQSLLLLRQSELEGTSLLEGLKLKGNLIDIGKGKDAYSINATTDYIKFEIDEDYKNFINVSYQFIAEMDILPSVDGKILFDFKGAEMPLVTDRFKYLKAERLAPDHNYKANLSAVQKDSFLGYRGENVPLFIALNKFEPVSLPSVQHRNAKTNNLISNLDAWLNDITPGSHVISTYYTELDIVKIGFQFDTGKDVTPQFSPVNVGFGFTYTLPVLTAILSAKKGDLLIIENPESHLHPQGQAKMGELLAKAASDGVQIIIESHSDHLFNGIRIAVKNGAISKDDLSVFYFERDPESNEHVTTIVEPIIESDGRISSKPTGFFDEYAKQLDSLIR